MIRNNANEIIFDNFEELYVDALQYCNKVNRYTTPALQRKYRISYNLALAIRERFIDDKILVSERKQ